MVLEMVTAVTIASCCKQKQISKQLYRKLPEIHYKLIIFPCRNAALVHMISLNVLGDFARFASCRCSTVCTTKRYDNPIKNESTSTSV